VKANNEQVVQRATRKAKKLYIVAAICLLLGTIVSAGAVVAYQTYSAGYHKEESLAQTAIQQLRTGVTLLEGLRHNPLDAATAQKARYEFASASSIFLQLESDLTSLPKISMSIPIYGASLSAASHVLPLAIEASQTGMLVCDTLTVLILRLHNPLNTHNQGLTMNDIGTIGQNFLRIRTMVNLISNQVDHLQPGDMQLDPRLAKMVATFRKDIPTLQTWLDMAEQLLPVAPALLGIGTPTNYLIVVLDSTELRPGGGFIGNYGIATFSGARLTGARITDTSLLDRPNGITSKAIPFPPAYKWFHLAASWSFRDSNLDADFPTAARYAEQNYKLEGGEIPVQGVIAITPALIQQTLKISGPIAIPEYHETVTSQNLISLIHYHQLGSAGEGSDTVPSPDGHSSERKRFTELLAEHFLARVRQLPSSTLGKFLQLMYSSLHTKDLQVYFNSSIAENFLQRLHYDAAIQSPPGDSLLVVDANISPNKANSFIVNTLHDQVSIDTAGNAVHHTSISYAWKVSGQVYGSLLYKDYVRIYVPPGSTLQEQNGWNPRGTSEAFDHEVWAGYFTLSFGQTATISLTWVSYTAAKQDTHGWQYQYMIQQQAGTQWKLNLQVVLPSCAVMSGTWGGLVSSSRKVVTMTQPLDGNTGVGVDYKC
jgi:hypothetical protein